MTARVGLIILALLSPICIVLAQDEPPPQTSTILATIGEFHVTPRYLDYVIRNHFAREIMEQVIRTRVVTDAAVDQGIKITHEQVSVRLAEEQAQFLSADDFLAHVRAQGLSEKGYREQLQYRMILDALLDKKAGITDEKVRAWFDEHPQEYGTEVQAHVLYIVTGSLEDAVVAYRAILDGTPFSVAARRFSDRDAPGADGDLGWVSEKTIPVPGLWAFVEALDEGHITEPFEMNGKYHLVQVAGRRTGTSVPFEEAAKQIRGKLREQANVDEDQFLTGLLAEADISVSWSPVDYLDTEYEQLSGVRVSVNGRPLNLLEPAYIDAAGVPMVPAKAVLQAIGAEIRWRPGPKILEATRGDVEIRISVGEKALVVGGEFKTMQAAAVIKNNITFIAPQTALAELGVAAEWNPTTKMLSVTSAQQ